MNLQIERNDAFETFLEELEEAIIEWQKQVKQTTGDKRFNARAYLAHKLGYKDEKIIYRFLDANDASKVKLGLFDVEIILKEIGDFSPLENYVRALGAKIKDKSKK